MKNLIKKPFFWLWVAIVLYVAVFCFLCFYKYSHFLYDGEDLAIFSNVFYNTAHGNFFWFSIHGGYNYLGDHLELGLLLLLPIYYFFQSPLTLLFLQTLLLGLSAWPLFLIAKHFNKNGRLWLPLLISCAWLLSPFLQNINLEEFHAAPLIIFLLLWTIYFNLKKNYRLFFLFFTLTLLTREDSALPLSALALINVWDSRHNLWQEKKWWLWPLLISVVWFFIALKFISFFSLENNFKYLVLYAGQNIFNPLVWIAKFFSFNNLLIIFSYAVAFLFFPLCKPKYLLLTLPTFLQISLLDSSNTGALFNLHYQAPIIIGLFIASAESLEYLKNNTIYKKFFPIMLGLFLFAPIYFSFYLGPLQYLNFSQKKFVTNLENPQKNQEVIKMIPAEAKISAPYRFLPNLSNRQTIYVNKLFFLGKRHLSTTDFTLPPDTEYILLDSTDMMEYYLHFTNRKMYSSMYAGGAERALETFEKNNFKPIYSNDTLLLLKKDGAPANPLFQIVDKLPADVLQTKNNFGPTELAGYTIKNGEIFLWWRALKKMSDDYFIKISFLNDAGAQIFEKIFPPAWGLLPTHNWQKDKFVGFNQPLPEGDFSGVKITLISLKGDIELGALNNTHLILDKDENLGEAVYVKLH